VALNRIPCPECGAGLKSASGFQVGQSVCCPKCETYFTVEEPDEDAEKPSRPASGGKKPVKAAPAPDDEDEEEESPRKKKRGRSDDEEDVEYSYKNSTTRYVILAILIAVMIGLGVMLYLKKQREAEEASDNAEPRHGVAAAAGV
jgi:hypothetical protein